MAKGLPEWEKLLEQSRGADDRLFQLNFAEEVMRRGAEGAELYDRQRQATRTGLAISQALVNVQRESAGRPARMLIFTDGYATEPLTGIAEKLKQQGIELDYHLTRDPEPTDYRVAALRVPTKAQLGEPFLLEIEVRGTRDGTVPVKILRQGRELKATDVEAGYVVRTRKAYPVYAIPLKAGMSIGMLLISVELLIMLIILLYIPGEYAGACFIGYRHHLFAEPGDNASRDALAAVLLGADERDAA